MPTLGGCEWGQVWSDIADRRRAAGAAQRAGRPGRAFHLVSKPVVRHRVEQSSLRAAPQHLSQSCGCSRQVRPEERGGDYDEKAYSCGHSARACRRGNGQRDGFRPEGRSKSQSRWTFPCRRVCSRLAGVRGPESWYPGGGSPGYHGGFIDLGPLGITAACGSHPHRYGYCGPGYSTPIDAWSY